MKSGFFALALAVALVTSACQQPGQTGGVMGTGISNQQAGTVLGGIGGGIAGHAIGKGTGNTVATIGGAVLGGMAGNSIGSSMDTANNAAYGQQNAVPVNGSINTGSAQSALENTRTGETTTWTNPDGSRGSLTPTETFVNNSGMNCRSFTQSTGYSQNSGTACRQANGVWVSQSY